MMEETPHVGEDVGEELRRGGRGEMEEGRGRWIRAGGDGGGDRTQRDKTAGGCCDLTGQWMGKEKDR